MKVINHYPSINSSGIFRNESIRVYFDCPIEATSISWDTFSVNDASTFSSVVGEIGPLWESGVNLSGVTSGIVFKPTINFLPNTEYTVYVYSAPNSILAKDGTQITNTYNYNFITGTGYYEITGEVGVPTGIVDYTNIENNLLYNIDSGLYIIRTNPLHTNSNIPTSSGRIDIFFNIPITTVDLSGYISVAVQDVLE